MIRLTKSQFYHYLMISLWVYFIRLLLLSVSLGHNVITLSGPTVGLQHMQHMPNFEPRRSWSRVFCLTTRPQVSSGISSLLPPMMMIQSYNVYIKKSSSNQKWASTGNLLSWKSEGWGERERGGWVDQQSVIFKVRFDLGEKEGRDRDTEIERHRNKET